MSRQIKPKKAPSLGGRNNKMRTTSELMECVVAIHRTLSICSRCLECCTPEERKIYSELSQDAALMLRKVNLAFKKENE
jgi:hypothetical protein